MKIVSIVGTRPNIIKLAAMHYEIIRRKHEHVIIHTGQHYDDNMSQKFFQEFDLPDPDFQIEIGHQTGPICQLSEMLEPLGEVLKNLHPDIVLIYGDTTSSLAGAIAAAQGGLDIAHIEAGVRSGSLKVLENLNRAIIDRIALHNFCVSRADYENLVNEGQKEFSYLVGDVMKDLFLSLDAGLFSGGPDTYKPGYILVTLHRPENVDDPERLEAIVKILNDSPQGYVWPMHPRTKKALEFHNIKLGSNISTEPPASYARMVRLIKDSFMVLTDSGGLQKEAYWAGKHAIVIWPQPIWSEIYETGYQEVSMNLKTISELLNGNTIITRGKYDPHLYGHGYATKLIMDVIEREDRE